MVVKKPNEIVGIKTLPYMQQNHRQYSYRPEKSMSEPAGESIIVFNIVLDSCSNWYNGFTYLVR